MSFFVQLCFKTVKFRDIGKLSDFQLKGFYLNFLIMDFESVLKIPFVIPFGSES